MSCRDTGLLCYLRRRCHPETGYAAKDQAALLFPLCFWGGYLPICVQYKLRSSIGHGNPCVKEIAVFKQRVFSGVEARMLVEFSRCRQSSANECPGPTAAYHRLCHNRGSYLAPTFGLTRWVWLDYWRISISEESLPLEGGDGLFGRFLRRGLRGAGRPWPPSSHEGCSTGQNCG